MNADIRKWIVRIVVAVVAVTAASAFAGTPVPGGKWSWVWTDKAGSGIPMRVYTYRPRACDTTCPILIALHGALRKSSDMRDYWELVADRYKFMVITPEFTEEKYPGDAYASGGMTSDQNQNREKTVFATVEHLFDEMRDGQQTYVLFGYSAGAQVAQRMALMRPDNRASTIVVANAGSFMLPEFRKDKNVPSYPASLVGYPANESDVRKALSKRLIVMVSETDNDPEAVDMGKSDAAVKQGASRMERAENFIKNATTVANELGVKFAWELNELPGPNTNAPVMVKTTAETLYKK